MPEMDTVSKIASEIVEFDDQIKDLRAKRSEREKAFIEAALATGRVSVKLAGSVVSLKEVEAATKVEIKRVSKKKEAEELGQD
jgi:hypothetical protein